MQLMRDETTAQKVDETTALRTRLHEQLLANEQAEAERWAQNVKVERLAYAEAAARTMLNAARSEIERLNHEHTRLQARLSWRLTLPLRNAINRFPRTGRMAGAIMRFAWRTVNYPRHIAARLHARLSLRQHEAQIAADPMFDAAYYCDLDPAISATGLEPVRHYLLDGRFKGLTPHPLFDPAWYRHTYSDIGEQDPLVHYIQHGRAEGRQPNAFFDPKWYTRQHPDVTESGRDPLLHFAEHGAEHGYDPSPLFQGRFYLDQYPDVASCGINPLAHYLTHGRYEGRFILPATANAAPVDATPIEVRKQPRAATEIAMLVTHSPNGRLKPHVRHYLQALKHEDIAVTLIVAADRGFTDDEPWLYDLVDGLYVRANEGWDFACWAHVLRLNRAFYRASILYWLNDSLIGPVNQPAFHDVLARVRTSDSGMVGLTANQESAGLTPGFKRTYHVQSFFLAFKPQALQSVALQHFVLGIQSLPNKEGVLSAYEVRLTAYLQAARISTTALFETFGPDNPVLRNWKGLLDAGFPFLKVAIATHGNNDGWRDALQRHGFDVALADRLLAERDVSLASKDVTVAGRGQRSPLANPPQITFVGPSNYANGLGVAARGYLSALMHLGLPTTMLPVERPFHIHQRVTPTLPSTECVGPADVALVHLNPDAWDVMLTPAQSRAIEAAQHRVGLFVWESHHLPPYFAARMRQLSAVWVPSSFCADGFRRVSEAPVSVVPYVVPVRPHRTEPARVRQIKQELGISPASRVILFSFDASSYLARKNPHALVRAFDRSELAEAGWRLVLKTKHLRGVEADGQALLEAVERSAGTLLLNRPIDAEAGLALLDMADIYVSPHASEGFGLTIAEAMARGKPVIASDFGGSTDFLDQSCGFPVRCTPWQLQENYGAYPRGTTWGRIDEDLLADTLMTVASLSAPALAEIGAKARKRIEAQLSPRAVAEKMRGSISGLLARANTIPACDAA